ncbi:hypothetical protein BGW80DRAFT_1446579 [Lactifluus volemus]|nr:hypothetical protein BGW80DRAFT_1446579 [Lactifluus volemus]
MEDVVIRAKLRTRNRRIHLDPGLIEGHHRACYGARDCPHIRQVLIVLRAYPTSTPSPSVYYLSLSVPSWYDSCLLHTFNPFGHIISDECITRVQAILRRCVNELESVGRVELVGVERELSSSALCKQVFEEGKEHDNIAGAFLEDKMGLWGEWPTSQERVGRGSQIKARGHMVKQNILFGNGQFHGVVAIRTSLTSFPVPNRSTVWSQLTGCHGRECSLLDDAVKQYQAKVGASLIEHQLAIRLRSCHTIESINQVLEEQVQPFRKSLGNDRHPKMTKSILRTVNVLHTVFTGSGTALRGLQGAIQAGHGVASVSIPSIKLVFSAIGILLAAVKDVNASYDLLFELFESLGNFVQRLDIYTQASPTMALRKVVVKIIIEMLSTLALATKQIKQGRLSHMADHDAEKFGLKLFGENKVEEALKKLDKLIQEEVRATAAQTLGAVSRLEQNTSRLEQNTRVIMDGETSHAKKEKADQIRRDLQHWLSPPNPWKNHNTACAARHDGTTTWLTQSDALVNWQSSGSLLWVCGKPGAGKTVLCMRKSGSASLAFFYCEFGDDEKRNSRGLMSSLLFQLHDQSQSYSEILSKFYSEHRNGSQEPSDAALSRCLNDIFRCAAQPPIYVIVDALDECPKAYGTPTPRGKVLKLVEELVCLNLPNLRICVTSRPETDIGAVLNRLKSHFVSLDEEGGQRRDIEAYVRSVVDSDLVIGTWGEEEKTLVTGALLQKGDRMFKWVSCQFDFLRRYPPERIRRALEELPDTLDGTYERSLQDIDEAIWDYAHRLFQCMAVASRPFFVEELAEFLAFDFEAGEIPKLVEDRRRKDPMQAVLTTCSSLITIVKEDRWYGPSDLKLVQFSHFSVKEFLMSGRLAAAQMPTIRRYNILTTPAHTMVTKACLGTLLHPDERLTDDSLKELPLAQYAARHWYKKA